MFIYEMFTEGTLIFIKSHWCSEWLTRLSWSFTFLSTAGEILHRWNLFHHLSNVSDRYTYTHSANALLNRLMVWIWTDFQPWITLGCRLGCSKRTFNRQIMHRKYTSWQYLHNYSIYRLLIYKISYTMSF